MKHFLRYLYILSIALMAGSCGKDSHVYDKGVAVLLNMPAKDTIGDIRLWVFDAQGVLAADYHYNTAMQLASSLLPLPSGNYTFVAGTNLTSPFAFNATKGTTKLADFLVTLSDASSSPAHAHFGVKQAQIDSNILTVVGVPMNRVLAELKFTIKDVPPEVASASVQVFNCAKGFYPGTGKLTQETSVANLGSGKPSDNIISFPLKRIMPVTGLPDASRASDTQSSIISITVNYVNGSVAKCSLIAPVMQNGGHYDISFSFSSFRPNITISITSINGWTATDPEDGEILNSDN